MNLEHLVTKGKAVLKAKQNHQRNKAPQLWGHKGAWEPTQEFPIAQADISKKMKMQLALKQHRFELHLSTYKPVFFSLSSKYYSTTQSVVG